MFCLSDSRVTCFPFVFDLVSVLILSPTIIFFINLTQGFWLPKSNRARFTLTTCRKMAREKSNDDTRNLCAIYTPSHEIGVDLTTLSFTMTDF